MRFYLPPFFLGGEDFILHRKQLFKHSISTLGLMGPMGSYRLWASGPHWSPGVHVFMGINRPSGQLGSRPHGPGRISHPMPRGPVGPRRTHGWMCGWINGLRGVGVNIDHETKLSVCYGTQDVHAPRSPPQNQIPSLRGCGGSKSKALENLRPPTSADRVLNRFSGVGLE